MGFCPAKRGTARRAIFRLYQGSASRKNKEKCDPVRPQRPQRLHPLLLKGFAGSSARGWAIGTTRTGQLRWEMADGRNSAQFQTPAPSLADGRWHHVIVAHDRDGDAIAYVDGIEIHRADIGDVGSVDASADFRIGGRFAGAVDNLQIWQRRLLPEEIRKLAATFDVNHPPFHDAVTDLRFDGTLGEAFATGSVTLDTAGVRGGSAAMTNIGAENPAYLSPQEITFVFNHFNAELLNASPIKLDIERHGNYAHLGYVRPPGGYGNIGIDYTAGGLRYQVEHSNSQTTDSWVPLSLPDFVVSELRAIDDGINESVTLRLPLNPIDHFRLRTTAE